VKDGRVRYAVVPGLRPLAPDQSLDDASAPVSPQVETPRSIRQWIQLHGRVVAPDVWAPLSAGLPSRSLPWGIGLQLYDLGQPGP